MNKTPHFDGVPNFSGHHERPQTAHTDEALIGNSPALRDALDRLERVAPLDTTVLLTGETGTGKELMARVLHRRSRRANHPMVAVNLAAIPESLVAAELFGHEAGAFTGASQRRIGRFELADHGTLFLDEVGELSPDMQVSLLRAVQEGEFERLGASQTKRSDARLITATNQNLEHSVAAGTFRADLFYRLSVFPIQLPPLRERREDIPALAEFLLHRLATRLGRHFTGIDCASMNHLLTFSWPGNIRQLQNVVEHSAILCDSPVLTIPASLIVEQPALRVTSNLDVTLRGDERRLIEQALERAEGRVAGPAGAAAKLGVPASTLESKIRRFNIDKLRYRMRGDGDHANV
jgi:transcriptional regulator with GAF, ATPase, and Fis domain